MLTALLYASRSWVTFRCHIRLLERFRRHRFLRTKLTIHRNDLRNQRGGPWDCWDTSLECLTSGYQDHAIRMDNCHQATTTEVHRKSVTKIRKRRPSLLAALISGTGVPRLLTEALGAVPSTKPPTPLKRTAVPAWRKRLSRRKNRVQAVLISDQTTANKNNSTNNREHRR